MISNNKFRIGNQIKISKNQNAHTKGDDKKIIHFGEFSSSHTENHFIATKIKDLIKSGVEPGEIAVIYRNNADSIDIADMLSRLGIEYTLQGGENVLETGVVIRLMHLLHVIEKVKSKTEDLDMFTLLNYKFMAMNTLDILRLSRFASARKINFFEAINHKDISKTEMENF